MPTLEQVLKCVDSHYTHYESLVRELTALFAAQPACEHDVRDYSVYFYGHGRIAWCTKCGALKVGLLPWVLPSAPQGEADAKGESWQWPEWLTAEWLTMDADGAWRCWTIEPSMGWEGGPMENEWRKGGNWLKLPNEWITFTPPPCTDWRESKMRNPRLAPPAAEQPPEPPRAAGPKGVMPNNSSTIHSTGI